MRKRGERGMRRREGHNMHNSDTGEFQLFGGEGELENQPQPRPAPEPPASLFGVSPETLEEQLDAAQPAPPPEPPAPDTAPRGPSLWQLSGTSTPQAQPQSRAQANLWEMAGEPRPAPQQASTQGTPGKKQPAAKSKKSGAADMKSMAAQKLRRLFPPAADAPRADYSDYSEHTNASGEYDDLGDYTAPAEPPADAPLPTDPKTLRRQEKLVKQQRKLLKQQHRLQKQQQKQQQKYPQAGQKPADAPKKQRGPVRGLVRLAVLGLSALFVLGFVAVGIFWAYSTRNDFLWLTLENIPYKTETILYATDEYTGETVEYVTIPCTQDKEYVDGAEMPQNLRDAFVAVEDKDFYSHRGVDIGRTVFAVANELKYKLFGSYIGGDDGRKQGASTIDQQLVKNLTRDEEATDMAGYLRKLREVWRAWKLDAKYSKDDILSAYLNTISFTGNTAGVQAESRKLFGKPVSELTLPECASIAAITRNPGRFNPATHPEDHLERRNYVLATMLEQGYITQEQHDEAVAAPVELTGPGEQPREEAVTSWFTDALLDELTTDLTAKYGISRADATNLIYNGGLRIQTTVAPGLQSEMERELVNAYPYPRPGTEAYGVLHDERGLPLLDEAGGVQYGTYTEYPEAAMVSLRYDGGVAAVVGSLGEKQISRGFNRGMDAVRQVGSTAKPIGPYVQAFEKGTITWSTPFFDGPVRPVTDEKTGITTENWPANVTNTYTEEDILVRDAFAHSVNTVAVRVGDTVGWRNIYNFERGRLGIDTLVADDAKEGPMALGSSTYGITPANMAKAYAMFGNGGFCPTVHCYTTVQNGAGQAVLTKNAPSKRAVSEESAFLVNRLMREVVENGTAAGKSVPGEMDSVGKTGTTSDNRDHWFIGLTPYYVTASWYGYDDNQPLAVDNYNHPPTLAWRNVMQRAQDGLPYKAFPSGGSVAQYDYCTVTGYAAGPSCPTATGWYETNRPPKQGCPQHAA